MAIKTTLEQLEEVQAAISKVLKAQEADSGGERILRAKLGALTARETTLLARYKSEQGRGLVVNTALPRRPY